MRRSRSLCSRQQGFSLVEVLIALVVLGIGLLGLARLQLSMLGGTAERALQDGAIRLAEDQLEALRFALASGQTPQGGSDDPTIQDLSVHRTWTWSTDSNGLAHTIITLRWVDPKTGEAANISLPASLSAPKLADQGWLIQSGPPSREVLP